MTCTNCSTETVGQYCHACGQKAESDRYTTRGLLRDFFFSVVDLEKGLPNTILKLTIQPGNSIRAVIKGERKNLYPAFKYLLLVGAVVIICSLRYRFFHNSYTSTDSKDMRVVASRFSVPDRYQLFVDDFFSFAEDNATLLNIAAIPIFAFFSLTLLSARRYNFAENLILNTFITAQQLFFLLLLIPFLEFLPASKPMLIALYSIAVVLYNIWAYVQFFGRKISIIIKSILAVLVAYACQFPLNFLIFYIYEQYIHYNIQWIPDAG